MCANCHLVAVELEINDPEAVQKACERLGWKFCHGKTTYAWVGKWYDDSPVPRYLFASDSEYRRVCNMTRHDRTQYMQGVLGNCNHAIQIPGAKGEIGLIERDGRLYPIWDYYSQGMNHLQQQGNPEEGRQRRRPRELVHPHQLR